MSPTVTCLWDAEAELRSHLTTSPFSRSTCLRASPLLTLTTNDSQKVNCYPNLEESHREVTWPRGCCGRTKNRRQKNLFPTSTAYQHYSSWKQHDEALPANNPAPNASYTTRDALEGKDAITSMHICKEMLDSLTERYKEKTFSESYGLVGKGENLAISRNEFSSENFVTSLFLTPTSWELASMHQFQMKHYLFPFKLILLVYQNCCVSPL